MTDLRDRETPVDTDGGAAEAAPHAASPDGATVQAAPAHVPAAPAPAAQVPAAQLAAANVSRVLTPERQPGRDVAAGGRTLELRALDPAELAPRRRTSWSIVLSLLALIVLPVGGGAVYLFGVASDQYVAETRFAVRKADAAHGSDGVEAPNGGAATTSSLLSGGVNLAGEDAEIVASYIHSRAAVDDVARQLDVRAIFQRPEADAWARLKADASAEELAAYWNRMVSVYVQSSSGIVIVSANAFRREDALALARAILVSAEQLANSLTVKMRADQTNLAEGEVKRSEAAVRVALADLTKFRNAEHLIDPTESSQAAGKLLLQLMSDRIATEGQLFVAERAQGPDAPGLNGTRARLASINTHITELQDQVAGKKAQSKNLAATLSRFEELELKKEFAEKLFDFARQGLQRAQLTALSQSIYLAVFMQPSLPQEAAYPERFTDFFLILLAAVMTWVSGATVTASILDHRL